MPRKEPEIIDTLDNGFGLFDNPNQIRLNGGACVAYRTIWTRNGLDFVHDRNCCYGTEKNVSRLEKYMGKMAKKVGKWAVSVGSASEDVLSFGEHFGMEEIEGMASPRGSYGYVYIQIRLRGVE